MQDLLVQPFWHDFCHRSQDFTQIYPFPNEQTVQFSRVKTASRFQNGHVKRIVSMYQMNKYRGHFPDLEY